MYEGQTEVCVVKKIRTNIKYVWTLHADNWTMLKIRKKNRIFRFFQIHFEKIILNSP